MEMSNSVRPERGCSELKFGLPALLHSTPLANGWNTILRGSDSTPLINSFVQIVLPGLFARNVNFYAQIYNILPNYKI